MFVKQIDAKTALELAARGKEVLVMVPAGKDPGWEGMMPDTLGHMLEGCMFFRREPAMEVELAGPAETEPAQPDPPPQPERSVARRRHWTSGSWWRCIMPAGRRPRLRTS